MKITLNQIQQLEENYKIYVSYDFEDYIVFTDYKYFMFSSHQRSKKNKRVDKHIKQKLFRFALDLKQDIFNQNIPIQFDEINHINHLAEKNRQNVRDWHKRQKQKELITND